MPYRKIEDYVPTRRIADAYITHHKTVMEPSPYYDGDLEKELERVRDSLNSRRKRSRIYGSGICFFCKSDVACENSCYCDGCRYDFRKEVELLRRKHGPQKGKVCSICRHVVLEKKLCLDHCHYTGNARGYICTRCNTGMTFIDNNPELFYRYVDSLPPEPVVSSEPLTVASLRRPKKSHSIKIVS